MFEILELLVLFWSVRVLICVLIGLPLSIIAFGKTESVILALTIIGLSFLMGLIWESSDSKINNDINETKNKDNKDNEQKLQ